MNSQRHKHKSPCLLVHVGLCLGIGQFYFPSKSQKLLKSSIQHIDQL